MGLDRQQYFDIYDQVLFHLGQSMMDQGTRGDCWEGVAKQLHYHGSLLLQAASERGSSPNSNTLTETALKSALRYFDSVRGPELGATFEEDMDKLMTASIHHEAEQILGINSNSLSPEETTFVSGLIEHQHIRCVLESLYPH